MSLHFPNQFSVSRWNFSSAADDPSVTQSVFTITEKADKGQAIRHYANQARPLWLGRRFQPVDGLVEAFFVIVQLRRLIVFSTKL